MHRLKRFNTSKAKEEEEEAKNTHTYTEISKTEIFFSFLVNMRVRRNWTGIGNTFNTWRHYFLFIPLLLSRRLYNSSRKCLPFAATSSSWRKKKETESGQPKD